jgi:O-acetyl-ADP-ribose deacetylase (regulator of RNase III)
MIKFRQGDILQADAEALVNTVNCVGIMGRGIALQFRKAFPENYEIYRAACRRQEVKPGKMLVFESQRFINPRYIINFPTKRHWKGKSRLHDIEAGLAALVEEVRARHIRSIAVPPLGCGLGGLDWIIVRRIIEEAFRGLPAVQVFLYEPGHAPEAKQMVKPAEAPRMTVGRAALLGLMDRYRRAVMDPDVSLLEIHKLMYFMQEAGEPLRLHYTKAPFGPYAANLRHVLSLIEGHFIVGYGDAEDDPQKRIEPNADATERAEKFLRAHPPTRTRFDRVADLIKGFETPFGMELLATVHWVAAKEGAATSDEAMRKVYEWNSRKRMFKPQQVHLALDVLRRKGWVGTNGQRL